MDLRFDGKTAVVAAGTAGLGGAIADELENSGATVIRAGRSSAQWPVDLLDADARAAFIAEVNRSVGAVDILVNGFLPRMRERGWGRIIAVGSASVQTPVDSLVASTMGRMALAGYLKSLSRQVAADGVTVNMVLPGTIATARIDALTAHRAAVSGRDPQDIMTGYTDAIPAGRLGKPQEFAAVAVFLASEAASYVTGEQIRCDGGAAEHL